MGEGNLPAGRTERRLACTESHPWTATGGPCTNHPWATIISLAQEGEEQNVLRTLL